VVLGVPAQPEDNGGTSKIENLFCGVVSFHPANGVVLFGQVAIAQSSCNGEPGYEELPSCVRIEIRSCKRRGGRGFFFCVNSSYFTCMFQPYPRSVFF
jgi:hypothetical protein